MNPAPYTFRVGHAACTVLLDGMSRLDVERMLKRFPDVPEAEQRRAYADLGLTLEDATSWLNVLLVRLDGETLLIDTGEGGRLLAQMQQAGIAPETVTQVIITHTHGDHVQGLLAADGQPAFPNATYVITAAELAAWESRIDAGLADHRPLVTLMQQRGLRQIDLDAEILPGVRAVPIPGHTPGQIGVRIESAGESLLHLADLLHSPMQFAHPEWSVRFDADTTQSVPTRRAALAQAADSGTLTLFYHLAFPGLGRVTRAGQAFAWEPLPPSGP